MNGCLTDHELWLAHEGEARNAAVVHLRACSECRARRDQLARDVKAISGALRGAAPRSRRQGPPARRRWQLAAAIAAGLALLAGVKTSMWRRANVIVEPAGQGSLETTVLLDHIAAMLAPVDAVSLAAVPDEDAGLADEMESSSAEPPGMVDIGAL